MKNKYEIRGDVAAIFINRRDGTVLETIVDTNKMEDIIANFHSIHTSYNKGNNQYYVKGRLKDWTLFQLHRFLINATPTKVVDHINHDSLDNRLCNLRLVTHKENMQNLKGPRPSSKSNILGVVRHEVNDKWAAAIRIDRKQYVFGYYETIDEAAEITRMARAKFKPYSKEARMYDVSKINLELPKPKEVRGIDWHKANNAWRVRIFYDRVGHVAGHFKNYDDALKALNETKRMTLEELQAYKNAKKKPKKVRPEKVFIEKQSNYKWVSWKEKNKKWQARITVNGKRIYLGLFENIADAKMAVEEAKIN